MSLAVPGANTPSGMADRHLVPRTSYDPPVPWDAPSLSVEQIHARHVAQQRQDLIAEDARQRDLRER